MSVQVGDKVDVRDAYGKWISGEVTATSDLTVRVQITGITGSKWTDEVGRESSRLAREWSSVVGVAVGVMMMVIVMMTVTRRRRKVVVMVTRRRVVIMMMMVMMMMMIVIMEMMIIMGTRRMLVVMVALLCVCSAGDARVGAGRGQDLRPGLPILRPRSHGQHGHHDDDDGDDDDDDNPDDDDDGDEADGDPRGVSSCL
jgi:hypothetical protein